MPRPRPTTAPRTRRPVAARPVVAVALAVVLADAVLTVLGARSGPPGEVRLPLWLPPARAAVAGVLLTALAQVLAQRARVRDSEQELWRRLAQALRCVALGVAVQAVVDAATALGALPGHRLLALPFLLSTLGACALAYQGLVVWNRVRTVTPGGSDWLNGTSAVLVVMAAGELVVAAGGDGVHAWPGWQVQGWLLRLGAGVVLLGATATVVVMTSAHLDRRRVLVLAAPVAVLAGTAVDAASPGRSGYAETASWVVAGALLAAAAARRTGRVHPRPPTAQEATVGSAVVMAAGVLVLVVDAVVSTGFVPATAYAALAVVGAGTRVWHLVRDLAHLATTREQALTDDLTGVANRRALMARLGPAVEGGVALLVLDLDGFKQVNDTWGHAVGDELLRVVAERLRSVLPPEALLARVGGDEFAVLLPLGAGAGLDLGERVVEVLAPPVEVDGRLLPVGVSVGIARTSPCPGALGADELLRRADAAMYLAKAAGGRRARAYDEAVDTAAQDRARLADDLRATLADDTSDDVVVHYQPQLDVVSGAVTGVEALVRWHHPRLGPIAPDDFLPVVEELGLMAVLTTRVLRRAAADSERWASTPGRELRLAVNLSASCLARPELVPLVSSVLARHRGLVDRLVLEVTETAIMADPGVALATMDELCALGVDFSIDDYGTGFASLAYLHDLPAVELKLDRSFTARLSGGGRTAAIVAGTVELAHQLGMRLVAEGVEDAETLAALARLGCDETQGYLHARPMPAVDLVVWLAAHRPVPQRPDPRGTAPRSAAPRSAAPARAEGAAAGV